MQRYYVNCGSINPKTLSIKKITFGKSMPSGNYIVSLTISGAPAYWADVDIAVSDKTKTGFTINLFNSSDYTVNDIYIDWIAISY